MINIAAIDRTAVKQLAKRLRDALAADGVTVSHSAALELVARQFGERDWNTLSATLPPVVEPARATDPVDVRPILRIFDEPEAYAFYLDYLGFRLDWVHRFGDHSPVYAQVSRGDVSLHLSGHHGDGSPGAGVLITVADVRALHAEITARPYPLNPGVEEQDWGLTLTVIDPFHNRITFHQPHDAVPAVRVEQVPAPIRHQLRVPVWPERAFELFTRRMGDWWRNYNAHPDAFTGIDLEPRVGGRVAMLFDGYPDQVWGEVTVWNPPSVYEQTFWLAQDPEYPSRLRVTFSEERIGSTVRFEHGGWGPGNAAARARYTDWPQILQRYVTFCEADAAADAAPDRQ